MSTAADSFYVTGGTLQRDAPSYVERQADADLYAGLQRGEYCYVLTSRQMGKSSLMNHTAARLRQQGVTVAVLDLTAIGQNLTAEQWYDGLLGRLGRSLDREDELEDYWLEHARQSPLLRWLGALEQVVLAHCPGRVVIFIDEIDAVLSLPFSTDEFFAAIRECYNRRTEDPMFQRLAFCLFGVATPSDLIQDVRTTPFNIGRRIELTDFSAAEAAPLAQGLGRDEALGAVLLKRVLYWTGGHPYLTQRLCRAVAEGSRVSRPAEIDRLCHALLLMPSGQEQDDNLLFVRERLLHPSARKGGAADLAGLLDLYRKVQRGKRVCPDDTDPLIDVLRLAGVVRVAGGWLRVRNRIYERVFDRRWVTAHMPDAELRRQRAAYRLGLLRAGAIATAVVAIMGGLALTAVDEARHAEQQRRRAEAQRSEARRNLYVADMNVAQQAWEKGNLRRAFKLLDEHRPRPGDEDLRGFEWRYLWRLCTGNQFATLRGHTAGISAVAFSPDGRTLASGGQDRTVKLWDLASGREVASLKGHPDWVNSIAFSPDGRALAAECADYTAALWDVASQREIATLTGHKARVGDGDVREGDLAFSPDGRILATSGQDGVVKLWDLGTRQAVGILRGHRMGILSLAFSPDGTTVATSSWDGTVKIWNLALRREIASLHWENKAVWCVAFSPNSQVLATGDVVGTVQLWRATTLQHLADLRGHTSLIRAVAFAPDSKTLATASDDHMVKLWDLAAGRDRWTLKGHTDAVASIAFSPDGRTLATGSPDRTVRLWSATAPPEVETIKEAGAPIGFSPEGRTLALVGEGHTVKLWDLRAGRETGVLRGHRLRVQSMAFSPDGQSLATTSGIWNDPRPGEAKLWDLATRREAASLKGHSGVVNAVAYSPDGKILATAGWDAVILWEVATKRNLIALKGADSTAAFSRDGTILATGGPHSTVRLWDVPTRRPLASLSGHKEGITSAAFSPDGKTLATSSSDQTIRLWNVARRQEIETLEGHAGIISSVAFSPDGKTLASSNLDGTVTLWNVARRQEVLTLKGHAGAIFQVAFSPNGNLLASSGDDGRVRLWRAATLAETDTQDSVALRRLSR